MALGLSVVPLLRCNTFAARRFPSVKSLSSPKTVIGVAEDYEHNLCLNVNSIHSFLPAPTRTRMHIPALYMSDQFFTSLQFTRSVGEPSRVTSLSMDQRGMYLYARDMYIGFRSPPFLPFHRVEC